MVADVCGDSETPTSKPLFNFCQPRSVASSDQKFFCLPLPDDFPISVRSTEAFGLFLIFFQILKKKERKEHETRISSREASVVCANSKEQRQCSYRENETSDGLKRGTGH